jgi:hypothetical protein
VLLPLLPFLEKTEAKALEDMALLEKALEDMEGTGSNVSNAENALIERVESEMNASPLTLLHRVLPLLYEAINSNDKEVLTLLANIVSDDTSLIDNNDDFSTDVQSLRNSYDKWKLSRNVTLLEDYASNLPSVESIVMSDEAMQHRANERGLTHKLDMTKAFATIKPSSQYQPTF